MSSEADIALCGDPTCESPSCRQSAIDAWHERQEQEARDIVRSILGLDGRKDESVCGRPAKVRLSDGSTWCLPCHGVALSWEYDQDNGTLIESVRPAV